eukprot:SAG31_NODE_20194_length_581_cov_1.082988_1_plen_169_part_01
MACQTWVRLPLSVNCRILYVWSCAVPLRLRIFCVSRTFSRVWALLQTGLVAFPTETTGVVRVIDTEQRHVVADIAAHRTALVAISISSDGKKLATASERGTVIRAYQLPIGTQLATFRRGTLPVTISSLSFNHPPTQLCSSSDSDTIHIFSFRESAAEDDDVHAPVSRG